MPAISQRDYETMLDCVGRLYECEGLELFPATALTEILRLVGAESSTFNYVAPSVPKVVAVARPEIPDEPKRTRRFAQYLPQHAALSHFLATGNPGAFKLSDFLSERDYHALPLYQEFYREIEYEDQLTFMLFPPGAELIGISLARSRRSFTERDRQILNLVRPHVARAYRHVERTALLQRGLRASQDGPPVAHVTSILLDAEDRPVQFSAEAQAWMQRFFPLRARAGAHLPDAVSAWLRRIRKPNDSRSATPGGCPVLVQEGAGERLRLRVFPHLTGTGRVLVLGLETSPEAARATKAGGLTRREIEVLLQVEQGKTNAEVGAALGISALTVRCHLERVFDKLQVPSRTAAVTRFRRLCVGHQAGDGQ
jgi:DNA-binding CsgD family transcriptional regulator